MPAISRMIGVSRLPQTQKDHEQVIDLVYQAMLGDWLDDVGVPVEPLYWMIHQAGEVTVGSTDEDWQIAKAVDMKTEHADEFVLVVTLVDQLVARAYTVARSWFVEGAASPIAFEYMEVPDTEPRAQ